jgi:hypothetical protein
MLKWTLRLVLENSSVTILARPLAPSRQISVLLYGRTVPKQQRTVDDETNGQSAPVHPCVKIWSLGRDILPSWASMLSIY